MIKYVLAMLTALTLAGCERNYCYIGHDVTYTVGATVYSTTVCDQYRNTGGHYPGDPDQPKGTINAPVPHSN